MLKPRRAGSRDRRAARFTPGNGADLLDAAFLRPETRLEQTNVRSAAQAITNGPAARADTAGRKRTLAVAARAFEPRAELVAAARRFVREQLSGHPAAYDATLLTSELVTNTVVHAQCAEITVTVAADEAAVQVEVSDDGKAGLPRWRAAGASDEDGRGFLIVDELARRWGFTRDKDTRTTTVWFVCCGDG